jgi:tRNA nucleotidyltransferase (CCA-adding enzyme)
MSKISPNLIPPYVFHALNLLEQAGFEAYIVGGSVRDLYMGKTPKDWDITTSAKPEDIQAIFLKTVYENDFGTVLVMFETEQGIVHPESLALSHIEYPYHIEITPYRSEGEYSDNRHPDTVTFSTDIQEDLQRRDFTINAIAYNPHNGQLIDLYEGIKDIERGVVRAVGDAGTRFREDALRMMRAIRFSSQLQYTDANGKRQPFSLAGDTLSAIAEHAPLIANISAERIRDEFIKIIETDYAVEGIILLEQLGLLKLFLPELREGIGCEQKGVHIYDVFNHLLYALKKAVEKNWSLDIRIAALFHDIGKPRTRRWDGTKAGGAGKYTFYGHEVIGARMTAKILERMKFPRDISEKITTLVRYHMFFSDTETITLSAVRRIIAAVGKDRIWDLMDVRICDRAGMNKVEAPYRLRKYHAMIEECLRDPISVSQLVVDGKILMDELSIKPGPRMGWMLHALLQEVLDDPAKNTRAYLDARVGELNTLSDLELKALGEQGKEVKEELEHKEVRELHKKHKV